MFDNNQNDIPKFLDRTVLILGENAVRRIINSHVLVLGVGGVGAYAAEMLVRSGVGKITIVDGDCVEYSNLNRQLVALNSTIGKPKTEVLKERLLDINPDCQVIAIQDFIRDEKIEELLNRDKFDYVVDAIDSLSPKVFFLAACKRKKLRVISSMGSGARLDPTKLEIADISKTYNCGLARAVRKRLKTLGINSGIKTVFSKEAPNPQAVMAYQDENNCNHSITGTVSYIPCVFGCTLASYVIKELSGDLK
jgi:tRNA A37 threonylcarbamoyladenosine dehydratase